jgi:hypothetical protein
MGLKHRSCPQLQTDKSSYRFSSLSLTYRVVENGKSTPAFFWVPPPIHTQPSELVVLTFLLLNLFILSSIFLVLFRVLEPALLSPKWLLLDLFVHTLTSVRHCWLTRFVAFAKHRCIKSLLFDDSLSKTRTRRVCSVSYCHDHYRTVCFCDPCMVHLYIKSTFLHHHHIFHCHQHLSRATKSCQTFGTK